MQTNYAAQVVQDIHDEARAKRAEYNRKGIVDVFTAMTWPNGMVEVLGTFCRGRFGGAWNNQTLADWARSRWGSGKLRLIRRGNVEGRPTATYEVRPA